MDDLARYEEEIRKEKTVLWGAFNGDIARDVERFTPHELRGLTVRYDKAETLLVVKVWKGENEKLIAFVGAATAVGAFRKLRSKLRAGELKFKPDRWEKGQS